ncbi:amidohydrolase family protein [Pseudonocardia broussonetiae]|uniref:Amidohydrolase family protein n=1 Tax=Pseudonocardia broussonetiae TaxID=2736640 RepID=A0A6M6JJ03_9PSEU|nr:amidohydrolase family protein [Pseudonocardia broussonetiae]QJY48028.1 amidohydrolase family protein [Pseudonocardia broussonetiae]
MTATGTTPPPPTGPDDRLRIVCLEEHVSTPALVEAWTAHSLPFGRGPLLDQLADLGEGRLAAMDDAGVDVHVLSVSGPGLEQLPAADAVALARDANDRIAAAVAAHPDRLQGFVTLPTPDPAGAAAELRRGVEELGFRAGFLFGRVGDRNVDHPAFDELWATAAELRVPVYLHPAQPPQAVRDAYYGGLGDPAADFAFSAGALGWHYEAGVQLLRLVYGRVFDRHPDLQVVVGHWGEVVLFYAERVQLLDGAMRPALDRSLPEYLRQNVFYTPSGMYSPRYLAWALDLVGAERLMFSTDHPYLPDVGGGASRDFLEKTDLLTEQERHLIAHGNWERLTARP